MLSPQSSIAYNIGEFSIRYYSVAMFFAILSGTVLSCIIARKYYKDVLVSNILDILPNVIIGAILGARLYYVLMDFSFYFNYPLEIFAIYKGGLSIHGGILGGFIMGTMYSKKHNLNLWKYADVFSYGIILGQIVGRIGNYFNIEAYGKPCSFSNLICLNIPARYRPLEFLNTEYFHPTFLYEMIWNIFVLLILFFIIRKLAKKYNGIVFFSYLILYSIGRFFIEMIRIDSVLNICGIHIAQIVSLLIILISILMIFRLKKITSKSQ